MYTITSVDDWWRCRCGNEPDRDGFYPCDQQGREIDPVAGWNGLYVCERCGRIIDQDTLQVVGNRTSRPSDR